MHARRGLHRAVVLAAMLFAWPALVHAVWPERPIRIVVPFAPGGAADNAARQLAPGLTQRLGQAVVIENKSGAGSQIGTAAVATAAADGYTLLMGSAGNAIDSASKKKLPYVFERDLDALALIAEVPGVVVVPQDLPVRDIRELIAYVKARDGQLSYGSPGNGTSVHLAGELFQSMTGTMMIHVPYRGASAALTDVLAQRLQLMFPAYAAAQPHLQAGKLRALAVTTRKRSALLPDLPTVDEAGLPGYEVGGWIGLFTPKGVPPDVTERLQRALQETLTDPAVRQSLARIGIEATPGPAPVLRDKVGADVLRWQHLIRSRRIDLQ